jgi:ureidoglycolate lyase
MNTLRLQRLTREAFAPFGDVIELDGARHFPINGGTTERFHDLATIDVCSDGGRPLVNVFRGQPHSLPLEIMMMERHPLGSQAFLPLGEARCVIVVAPAGEFDPSQMRAFWTEGWQGVNYAKGVWHHPLLALDRVSDFVVIDRGGEQPNCDEVALEEPWRLEHPDATIGAEIAI